MDAHLAGALELSEFQKKKNVLIEQKADLQQKLRDFERKRNHWLELTRNWILEANQNKNLASSENFSEMKNFLKKAGLNRQIKDRKLFIDFKKPWNYLYFLPAERRRREAEIPPQASNTLWSIFTTKLELILPKIPEKIQSLRPAAAPQSGAASQKNYLFL